MKRIPYLMIPQCVCAAMAIMAIMAPDTAMQEGVLISLAAVTAMALLGLLGMKGDR